jgi:hypothetical protein
LPLLPHLCALNQVSGLDCIQELKCADILVKIAVVVFRVNEDMPHLGAVTYFWQWAGRWR